MESLVYFHPAPAGMYKKDAAKGHWWQEAALQGNVTALSGGGLPFSLSFCPVPPFYHRQRPWPPEELSRAMEAVREGAVGIADAWLHPQIMTYLSENWRQRWEPRRETWEALAACVIKACGASCLQAQGEAWALLGSPEDALWQMEMAGRLLWPYLARVNRLSFYYKEAEGADLWEEAADCLEACRYEYGLAPRLIPYRGREGAFGLGGERLGGLILDFGGLAGCPRVRQGAQAVCVDLRPGQGGGWKSRQILHASPLKYLDTALKNEYHKEI